MYPFACAQEEVISATPETEKVLHLTALQKTMYGYGLANGTVGVYDRSSRLWRVKSKNKVCRGNTPHPTSHSPTPSLNHSRNQLANPPTLTHQLTTRLPTYSPANYYSFTPANPNNTFQFNYLPTSHNTFSIKLIYPCHTTPF